MKSIPYGRQFIDHDDIEFVVQTLKSDFLTQGSMVPKFEEGLSSITSAKYATVVNSATSALHLACSALDLKPGEIVWTVPNTFVASANCALYCGAKVDFVDIDPKTALMSVTALEKKLKLASKNDTLPKVIVPVHLCGTSCDMAAICELANKYQVKVLEDSSHAIGGKYRGLN